MPIPNQVLRSEGNKAYPATANAWQPINGGYIGLLSVLAVTVKTLDGNGNDLGDQTETLTVDGTEPDYNPTVGGIHIFHAMRELCKRVRNNFDPTVSCWASGQVGNTLVKDDSAGVLKNGPPGYANFNIQPKGSNGLKAGNRVNYELVQITSWTFTVFEPVVAVAQDDDPDTVIEQTAGTMENPAILKLTGNFSAGQKVATRIDTDEPGVDPQTVEIELDANYTAAQVAEKLCAAIMAAGNFECETQDGVLYIVPKSPATAISIGAAGIID